MKRTGIILIALLAMCHSTISQIIHIPLDQPTIQAGIDSASAGDTILVAEGTYLENINFRGKAITVASHYLLEGDTSHISKTIIDGSQPTHPDSGSVVTFWSGEDTTSVLTGFTVTGGSGTLVGENDYDFPPGYKMGGGIFIAEAGARISWNIIEENQLVHPSSYSHMEELFDSLAFGAGISAAVYGEHNLIVEHNIIQHNHIESGNMGIGGGIFIHGGVGGKVDVNYNHIRENNIETDYGMAIGGGIDYHCPQGAIVGTHEILIRNNVIAQNKAIGNPNSELLDNFNFAGGGGIFIAEIEENVNLSISNNILWENYTNCKGGGILFEVSEIELVNNTFLNNVAEVEGNSIWARTYRGVGTTGILLNNLLWSENASAKEILMDGGSTIHAFHNNIKGGWTGKNISADPMVDEATFELMEGSPCIGSGIDSMEVNGTWYTAPSWDYRGNDRPHPIDYRMDMGAIESPYARTPIFFIDENGVTIKCENCVPGDTGTVNGILYEAVDRELLDQRRDEGADLSTLCTSLATEMDSLFYGIEGFNQDIGSWDVSAVTTMSYMFHMDTAFNQDIGSWDVSSVLNMSHMFEGGGDGFVHTIFTNFDMDISDWDVSNVTNMRGMFAGTANFNRDIGSWDVRNVTDMVDMFGSATAFNQDIGSWDVSNVTDMEWMFYNANIFNQDIGSWDVSNVTDMGGMFGYAAAFNQDIGFWDVSNVTDMGGMYHRAASFNQDIGSWDVSRVTDMESMFKSAASFNQDLSGWCVEKIASKPDHFAKDCPLQTDFYPKWGTCPSTVHITDIDNSGSFSTYPNPTSTFLTIETGISGSYGIDISSLNGRLLYQWEYEEPVIQLDLSSFQKGVYLITIRSKESVTTKKIVKL